jgi:hypothetical protein
MNVLSLQHSAPKRINSQSKLTPELTPEFCTIFVQPTAQVGPRDCLAGLEGTRQHAARLGGGAF